MQTFGSAAEAMFMRLLEREVARRVNAVTGLAGPPSVKDFETYKFKCGEIAALRSVPFLIQEARDIVDGKVKFEEQ